MQKESFYKLSSSQNAQGKQQVKMESRLKPLEKEINVVKTLMDTVEGLQAFKSIAENFVNT